MIESWIMYKNQNGYWKENATNLLKTVIISGSKDEVARKLEATFFYSIFDRNHERVQIGVGSKIWIVLDGKEIFRGIVWDRELNSHQELVITAYDYLVYLLKSTVTYNFKKILAEDAVKKIITELGLQCGSIPKIGIRISRLIQDKTGYEAIMEVLTQVSKQNGKQYIPVCDGTKISIIEKGATIVDYELTCINAFQKDNDVGNVINTSYKDTMENMVGRVKIYDDKGNYISKVENSSLFEYYGIIQKTYQKEEDKNPTQVAGNMLHGVDQECSIEALGNWECRTGYAIKTKIFYINNLQNGLLYIDGDTHTWEMGTGKHTMTLDLSYKNEMDSKED